MVMTGPTVRSWMTWPESRRPENESSLLYRAGKMPNKKSAEPAKWPGPVVASKAIAEGPANGFAIFQANSSALSTFDSDLFSRAVCRSAALLARRHIGQIARLVLGVGRIKDPARKAPFSTWLMIQDSSCSCSGACASTSSRRAAGNQDGSVGRPTTTTSPGKHGHTTAANWLLPGHKGQSRRPKAVPPRHCTRRAGRCRARRRGPRNGHHRWTSAANAPA